MEDTEQAAEAEAPPAPEPYVPPPCDGERLLELQAQHHAARIPVGVPRTAQNVMRAELATTALGGAHSIARPGFLPHRMPGAILPGQKPLDAA